MAPEEIGTAPRGGPLASLYELLFPSRCLGCGRRGAVLCAACRPGIPWLPSAACPRCAHGSINGRLCRRCERGGSSYLRSVRAACTFDGVIRTAIHQLKFRHARFLAPFLAQVLARSLARRPLQADLLVPVPLSHRRKRERGFNQSELIAVELARLTPLPSPASELLVRTYDTQPQVGLPAAQRRRNLRGAFTCASAEQIIGRRCLLFDDVMTTGATLDACAQPLIEAGAESVLALVVAREF